MTTPPWPASSWFSSTSGPPSLFDASAEPAAPAGPLLRVRLLVAYDGRGFHGFAANPGVRTVDGTLSVVLERVLRHRVELVCAGRTDAGVHAWGQVVSFDAAEETLDLSTLQRAVNGTCGPELVVRRAEVAPPDFDARRSARCRRYHYSLLNVPVPHPFLAATSWQVEAPLDLEAMRLGCDPLIGEHDFTSFCRRPRGPGEGASLVRRVLDARWVDLGEGRLRFEIEASSFCHQMVRSLVGTLVAMGAGRHRPGEMTAILRAADRHAAGDLAPPHGLCLWHVGY